ESESPEHEGDAYRAQSHADLPAAEYRVEQENGAEDGREDYCGGGRMSRIGAGEPLRYEPVLSPGEDETARIEQLRSYGFDHHDRHEHIQEYVDGRGCQHSHQRRRGEQVSMARLHDRQCAPPRYRVKKRIRN